MKFIYLKGGKFEVWPGHNTARAQYSTIPHRNLPNWTLSSALGTTVAVPPRQDALNMIATHVQL